MQTQSDVTEFLGQIDAHLKAHSRDLLAGSKFELKIIGKSALLLAGLTDSVGTVDIDSLRLSSKSQPEKLPELTNNLATEFGRAKIKVHGHYLEFVDPAIVFLSQSPSWNHYGPTYECLSVHYLDPSHVIASKLFSTFSEPLRKRDQQDIVKALDQKLVEFQTVLNLADQVFDLHSMDSRSDRFPRVYDYIVGHLMPQYGPAMLKSRPQDE